MLNKSILCILTLIIGSNIFACSCSYSEDFNLVEYDFYENVFEVKIDSKYSYNSDILKSDTLGSDVLYEIEFLSKFNITLIEVFKGDIKLNEKIMGFPSGSSCSWTPEIESTYIFYADHINGVEMCNRILIEKYNKDKFEQEKSILRLLKANPSEVEIKIDGKVVIQGSQVKGERNGVWNIYSSNEKNNLIFQLSYKNGDLVFFEKGVGYSEEEEWHIVSYYYFEDLLK